MNLLRIATHLPFMTNHKAPAAVQLLTIALVALLFGMPGWFALLVFVVVILRELAREVLPAVLEYLRRQGP